MIASQHLSRISGQVPHKIERFGRVHAGTGAGRAIGTGLNVKAIRNAPSPMIQEPM